MVVIRDAVNDTVRWLDTDIMPPDGLFAISSDIPRRYLDRILSDSTGVMWETTPEDKIIIEAKKKLNSGWACPRTTPTPFSRIWYA